MDEKARARENDAFWESLVAGEVTEAQATARRLIDITPPVSAFFDDATETEGAEGEQPRDHVGDEVRRGHQTQGRRRRRRQEGLR